MTVVSPDRIEGALLESEHRRVRGGLSLLEEGLDRAHTMSRSAAVDQVVRTLGWLRRDLLPHAAWEEAWLYPHLDATTGTPWATRTLRFEHEQIRDLAAQLEGAFSSTDERWSLADAFRLVIALARLESVVSAHLAKEHWFIAPLLESPERELQHEGGAP